MREQVELLCAEEGYDENDGEEEQAEDLAASTEFFEAKSESSVLEPAPTAMAAAAAAEHGSKAEADVLAAKLGRGGGHGGVRGRGGTGRGKQHNVGGGMALKVAGGGKDGATRSRAAQMTVEMGTRCIVPASEFGVLPEPGELDHYVGEVSDHRTLP